MDIKTTSVTGNFDEDLRDIAIETAKSMAEDETTNSFNAGKASIFVSRDRGQINTTMLTITIDDEKFFVGV